MKMAISLVDQKAVPSVDRKVQRWAEWQAAMMDARRVVPSAPEMGGSMADSKVALRAHKWAGRMVVMTVLMMVALKVVRKAERLVQLKAERMVECLVVKTAASSDN